ncbi:hypothetical protein [Cytobacillus purgationiresistens]|uniref:Uncharacterized protein n=1 Tax=Cytobacillus purgationiresistens TaxID=863449 RepID=A0ABU0ADL3_9BACI|nr:hypothetical protein [Cytobacillus purgationiresistens]MDQ0268190.1 hypothetical protein [Cytobacillus purgationiresistens]
MPKKAAESIEPKDAANNQAAEKDKEIAELNHMLAAVLTYLSDEEVEEIDIEYLLTHTEGLREWWDQYRETNKKQIEEEIKQSLGGLSLKELESIRETIKERNK